MTDKDLKNIYEYMGWAVKTLKVGSVTHYETYKKVLDSNSAWECVQEMGRKGDWHEFYIFMFEQLNNLNVLIDMHNFALWNNNPTNFFNCMAKWCEAEHE